MSKEALIILLGLWTVVLTQLGLPYRPWGALLFALTGAAVAVLGFLLRGEALGRTMGETLSRTDTLQARTPIAHEQTDTLGPLN